MGNMLPGAVLGCVCISVWKHKGLIYPQEYVGGKEVAEKHPELYENHPCNRIAASMPSPIHYLLNT